MESIIKKFNEYAKRFDLRNVDIMDKYHHSYRVMEYSKDIAKSLNLSDEEIYISMVIGLLHDISRFKQWTEYETYNDTDSFDHGDRAIRIIEEEKILENFEEEKKKLILASIKNHNKYEIEQEYKDNIFAKIIRDADKIDIIKEQGNIIRENNNVNYDLFNYFDSKKMCSNQYVKSDSDYIVRMLSWIYDLNFKYSYEYLENNNIIKNKIELLKIYNNDIDKIERLEEQIYKDIKERLAC